MSPRLAEALRRRRRLASQPFVSLRLSPSLHRYQIQHLQAGMHGLSLR